MTKTIFYVLFFVILAHVSNAANLYMSTTGTDSGDCESSPCLTLQYSISQMDGGDTLEIADGTYTGTSNSINTNINSVPPVGVSGAYTIIKAEHDGGVLFDGEDTTNMFYVASTGNKYWQFEGLIWGNSPGSNVLLYWCSYVKFLRCGAFNAGSGNNSNFAVGKDGSYILVEGCYSWGSGRYKFMGYQGDYLIFRNCVGRADIIDAGGEPCAIFSMYSCDYSIVQNCIAIDSDQTSYYSAGLYQGPFFVPSTDMNANYTSFVNCIGLNVHLGGIQTAASSYMQSYYDTFSNCVIWGCHPFSGDGNGYGNWIRGYYDVLNHMTIGDINMSLAQSGVETIHSYDTIGDNDTIFKNSLVYGVTGSSHSMFNDVENEDYNAFYANTVTLNNSGAHDITNANPIWSTSNPNGALKYLTRIESGSNLSGLADDSGDIGANVLTLIGTSGTLYGEAGYDSDTGVSMWPFPNEDLIKTKMVSYNSGGVSGARGFCAGNSLDGTSQTLTKYIWEYLGNQIPNDIYGSTPSCGEYTDQSSCESGGCNWCNDTCQSSSCSSGGDGGHAYGVSFRGARLIN